MWFFCCSGTGKNCCSAVEDLSSDIEAVIEQYDCRENVRVFGVNKDPGADVFIKVVSVTEMTGVIITSNDICTCHRLPSRCKDPKPIVAKIVRRDTKHQLMKK